MATYGVPTYDPRRDPTTATIRALTQAPIDPAAAPMTVNDFFQFANQQRVRQPLEQQLEQRQASEANATQSWMNGLNKQQAQMSKDEFERGIKIGDEQRAQEAHDRKIAEEDDQARKRAEIERTFGVGGVEGARLQHQKYADERQFREDAQRQKNWEAEQKQQERFHVDTTLKAQDANLDREAAKQHAEEKARDARIEQDAYRKVSAAQKSVEEIDRDLKNLKERRDKEASSGRATLDTPQQAEAKATAYETERKKLEALKAQTTTTQLVPQKISHLRTRYVELRGATDDEVKMFMALKPDFQAKWLAARGKTLSGE
jgi:hypothetical protein